MSHDHTARRGCVLCRYLGMGPTPAEIHHIRRHGGKRDNAPTIPLCYTHHRGGGPGVAVHSGRKSWEDRYQIDELTLYYFDGGE